MAEREESAPEPKRVRRPKDGAASSVARESQGRAAEDGVVEDAMENKKGSVAIPELQAARGTREHA
jgi:hypothetical protein